MQRPSRPVPAHIECWNCGEHHFAHECTKEPDARSPVVQQKVNAVDSSLQGQGIVSTQEITEQFETMEAAASWIAHVRKNTEEMVRAAHHFGAVTSSWSIAQVRIAAVQQQEYEQQQQEYEQQHQCHQRRWCTSRSACAQCTDCSSAGWYDDWNDGLSWGDGSV